MPAADVRRQRQKRDRDLYDQYVLGLKTGEGRLDLEGGLTVFIEHGKRRYVQICPTCSSSIELTDLSVAALIGRHGCFECRWMGAE